MRLCINHFVWIVFCILLVSHNVFAAEDTMWATDSLRAYVQDEKTRAEKLRSEMLKAIVEDRNEDIKQIARDIDDFDQSSIAYPVFLTREKYLLNYFIHNFDFWSNVDSVDVLRNIDYGIKDTLFVLLRSHYESAKIEKTLKNVENKSDRAFIYIVLNSLFEKRDFAMDLLLKKYKSHLTNQEQRTYLVNRFEINDRSDEDVDVSNTIFIGAGIVKPMGAIADTLSVIGVDISCGQDWIRKNLIYELLGTIHFFNTKEPQSWRFVDLGFDFNFGYKFVSKNKFNLFGAANVGIDFNYLGDLKDESGKNVSPIQFYPTFGANLIGDLWASSHSGVRLRVGVSNLWSDKVVKSSGVRLFATIEWLVDRDKVIE